MAEEDERVTSPNGVFGPILLRSSTPPPSEKVSMFLRGMAEAERVSKPMSNYGSEFDHMPGAQWDNNKGINIMGGRQVTIPSDANEVTKLNEELFKDGSELSYGGALGGNNGHHNNEDDEDDNLNVHVPDDIQSVEQEHASTIHVTPKGASAVLSPGKSFRNGKVIDSSETWGNKGLLPDAPQPFSFARYADTPAHAANVPLPVGNTPATPSIMIQPPSSGIQSRAPSHAPSRAPSKAPSEARSRTAGKTKSHMSEVMNGNSNRPPVDLESTSDGGETEHAIQIGGNTAIVEPIERTPSRARSRAHSRADRPMSPGGRTDRSRAQTAARVPLPSSPGNHSAYVPLHFSSPPKSPSRAGSKVPTNAGSRAQSPLGNGSKQPSFHPLSKRGESVTSPKSRTTTRLHPLTDLLRDDASASPSKARSRGGTSVQSHRTGGTNNLPPITVQITGDGLINPSGGSRAPSRARSHVSKKSEVTKPGTAEDDEDDDDDDNVEDRMKSLTINNNPSREQVTEIDLTRTPRTSYTAFTTPSVFAGEVGVSHYHDEELCILLHAADNEKTHDVVKKVLRKGVRERVNKLGLDHQKELVLARRHHRDGVHRHRALRSAHEDEDKPPKWAEGLFDLLKEQQHTIDRLEEEQHRRNASIPTDESVDDEDEAGTIRGVDAPTVDHGEEDDDYENGQTVPIDTPRQEDLGDLYDDEEHDEQTETRSRVGTNTQREYDDEQDSEYNPHLSKPELYRLRIKEPSAANPHEKTWHITDTNGTNPAQLPEIPNSEHNYMEDSHAPPEEEEMRHHEVQERHDPSSPPLPPLPLEAWSSQQLPQTPSWQRVYQRLLNWALVWSEGELQRALASTESGKHVDEVALTIWITQTYKRYVRAKHVEHPPGRVDRLYVPPNIADAINVAVFHGRHGDAKQMLRDLWAPFGFEGMPRLLIVLARHRRDSNHYVVHRFALPEGSLTTYDTYPEKTLADGRPLGWWFAIQAAWPNSMYPQPDNLVQKIIRINRPMQLNIDNSVAAAAIWRNLIMGSKAERSVDLVRLRDLITTEVKSIISRKELGRLSVMGGKSQWEEIQP